MNIRQLTTALKHHIFIFIISIVLIGCLLYLTNGFVYPANIQQWVICSIIIFVAFMHLSCIIHVVSELSKQRNELKKHLDSIKKQEEEAKKDGDKLEETHQRIRRKVMDEIGVLDLGKISQGLLGDTLLYCGVALILLLLLQFHLLVSVGWLVLLYVSALFATVCYLCSLVLSVYVAYIKMPKKNTKNNQDKDKNEQ